MLSHRINELDELVDKRLTLANRLIYFNLFEALKLMLPGITLTIVDGNGNVRESYSELTAEEALDFQPSVNLDDDIYPVHLPKHNKNNPLKLIYYELQRFRFPGFASYVESHHD